MRIRPVAASHVLVLVLVLPAPAAGQTQNAPPGNSGVDQYLETVPGPAGEEVPQNGLQGTSDTGSPPLDSGTTERLEAAGEEGRALERIAGATDTPGRQARRQAPTTYAGQPAARSRSGGRGEPSRASVGASVPDRTVPEALFAPTLTGSGSGGLGLLLPGLLALSVLGTVAVALRRGRSA